MDRRRPELTDADPVADFDRLLALIRPVLPGDADVRPPEMSDDAARRVLALAASHRVLPLVHAAARDALPADLAESLRDVTRTMTMRTLSIQTEAASLATLLTEADVPFLLIKGVALRDAYGSPSLRPYVDNDLLVPAERFGTVERLVVESGYVRERRSPWQKKAYLFIHGQYTFGRFSGSHVYTLDMHTSVMPFGYRYRNAIHMLRDRSRTVSVGPVEIPVPSWEDELIILCVNGIKDRWSTLRLVADLANVSARVRDWETVHRTAQRTGALYPVLLGMELARDVLGLPFPEALGPVPDRVRDVARDMTDRLRHAGGGVELSEWDRIRLYLGIQDDLRGRLRYIAYTAIRRSMDPFIKGTGVATDEL